MTYFFFLLNATMSIMNIQKLTIKLLLFLIILATYSCGKEEIEESFTLRTTKSNSCDHKNLMYLRIDSARIYYPILSKVERYTTLDPGIELYISFINKTDSVVDFKAYSDTTYYFKGFFEDQKFNLNNFFHQSSFKVGKNKKVHFSISDFYFPFEKYFGTKDNYLNDLKLVLGSMTLEYNSFELGSICVEKPDRIPVRIQYAPEK